jgi:hypothetical protein
MTRFSEILRLLEHSEVEFIVVGGLAATIHGSSRHTRDVDVVYARNKRNLERLVGALAGHEPSLRGAPPGLPFRFDLDTLKAGLNFTLVTNLGWIDLLGEITGGGKYEDLVAHTIPATLYGTPCLVLDLETLIRTKRAAGRPRDFDAIAELELLRDRAKPPLPDGRGSI